VTETIRITREALKKNRILSSYLEGSDSVSLGSEMQLTLGTAGVRKKPRL
jgi:hypothetical protein